MTAVRTETYIHRGQGNGGERSPTYVSWSKRDDSQIALSLKTCSKRLEMALEMEKKHWESRATGPVVDYMLQETGGRSGIQCLATLAFMPYFKHPLKLDH